MGALPTSEETSALVVRVPHETKQTLIEQARSHGRSLSGELRLLLGAALERERAAGAPDQEARP